MANEGVWEYLRILFSLFLFTLLLLTIYLPGLGFLHLWLVNIVTAVFNAVTLDKFRDIDFFFGIMLSWLVDMVVAYQLAARVTEKLEKKYGKEVEKWRRRKK